MNVSAQIKFWLGPVLGVLVYLLMLQNGHEATLAKTAGLGVFIASWWITEAVNIYYTALLPIVLFPLFGVMDMASVAPFYMKDIIFLFIGTFLIAFGLERWNLHKRIALKIILLVGNTPARMLMGFMLASYLLSMWILNTATVSMLLPAVLAVIAQIETYQQGKSSKLVTPFLLGLAFASSIGGMTTLIGTLPNLVFSEFYHENFPNIEAIDFVTWIKFGLPVSAVMLVITFFVLRLLHRNSFQQETIDMHYCKQEYEALGPLRYEEKILGLMFLVTVLLWFFRKDLTLGSVTIPGWTSFSLFEPDNFIKESTIAMLTALALFLIPSKDKTTTLISWEDVKRLPLGILFLFGGGFALAGAFKTSGLSDWVGVQLGGLADWPPVLIVVIICLVMTFLTELTSNTASTLLLLPVVLSLATNIELHPLLLLIPLTLSASCAFMLPVATPPNTIVFGSERLQIKEMMRVGIWLNLIGVVIISLAAFTIISWVFNL